MFLFVYLFPIGGVLAAVSCLVARLAALICRGVSVIEAKWPLNLCAKWASLGRPVSRPHTLTNQTESRDKDNRRAAPPPTQLESGPKFQ